MVHAAWAVGIAPGHLEEDVNMRVGIVGVGFMGQAYLANLLKAGFTVQGYDIDPARMDQLKERGGIPVDSPAAAARGVRLLVTSLLNNSIVREAALGPNGVAEGVEEGFIIADTSTSLPEEVQALGADLAERGIRYLDASVSGSGAMAMEKDLVLVVGGEKEDFDACGDLFAAISRAAYLMGPLGSGTRTKLIISIVLYANRLGLAEGLVLGMKAGMDTEALLTVLKDSAAYSKQMDQKGEKMIQGDTSPESRLTISLKDSRFILEQGRNLGIPMFTTSLYSQIAQIGAETGCADLDPASLVEVLREMAGLPRRK